MTTEADDDAIFDNDVIDLQKTYSIDFRYTNYRHKSGKSISVTLREGDTGSTLGSSFVVSGKDTAWVDATFVELERIVSSIQPQSGAFRKYRPLVTALLAFSIGRSITTVFSAITPAPSGPVPWWVESLRHHMWILYVALVISTYMAGIFPAMTVSAWVARLWPAIEFDFGPEHLKQNKRVRERLGVVAGLILLPFALTAFQQFVLGWK